MNITELKRRQVLAQWRRVDTAPEEAARADTCKPAAALLPRITASLKLDKRREETEILKAWAGLMDPNVTAHARPKGFHKGTLFVAVDSSVWLDEIVRYRRFEILERLQNCFGRERVVKISYSLG